MDEFFVEAVNIGELRKIKIGHDNAGKVGTSWFLDRVEIDSPLLGKHWVFPFRRWLSKGDLSVEMVATVANDARMIPGFSPVTFSNNQEMRLEDITKSSTLTVSCENTLQTTKHCDAASNSEDGIGSYRILVYTGNKLFAGTDANVHIEMFGEKGDTGILELKSSKRNWNKFERNKKDEFIIDISDVGELIKIRIGHDNSGLFGSSWFLDRVEVESKLLGKLWRFPYRHWISKEKHGCNLEAELYPHEVINVSANDLSGSDRDCNQSDVTDSCVKASGHGLENQPTVDSTTSFLVDVSEADPGNLLLLSIQGPTEPCQVNMTYEGNGIYNVSYQPRERGVHIISIKWGKRYITGSPFVVNVV